MNIKTFLSILLVVFTTSSLFSQTIWSEDFDVYTDGTTTGTASSWTSTCPACLAGDHFEVQSGVFSGNDVNTVATWESESIDISGYATANFSLDAIDIGDHEGPGCNCTTNIDYFDISYNVDGGAFTLIENWNGDGVTGHTLTGDSQNGVFTDADWGTTTVSQTGLAGATLVLRIEITNSSGSEEMNIDNILVTGVTPLPVELVAFKGILVNSEVQLTWQTLSERNNSHFEIQKSIDGEQFSTIGKLVGKGTTTQRSFYSYTDEESQKTAYYRLNQIDYDGTASYSNVISVSGISVLASAPYPNPFERNLFIELKESSRIEALSLEGKLLAYLDLGEGKHDLQSYLQDFSSGVIFLKVTSSFSSEVFTLNKL